jgi:hypothetical protein
MVPQRIGAKMFFEDAENLDLSLFIPVFHRWIRNNTVEGMLIDVADYKHVPDGPGVMLIGHDGDYSIDLAEGRPGLRYVRKRGWDDPAGDDAQILQARLGEVLRMLQLGVEALAGERKLRKAVKFAEGELQVSFNDQLRTPNTAVAFAAIEADILATLMQHHADTLVSLERTSQSPHEALTVNVVVREVAAQAV